MALQTLPAWTIPGVVTEKRELKTKQDRVWAYAVKVMAMGGMFELQTQDETLYQSVGVGTEVQAAGRFDQFNGAIKLILTKIAKAV